MTARRKPALRTAWSPNPDGSSTLYAMDGETYVRPLALLRERPGSLAVYRLRGPAVFGRSVTVLSGDARAMAERAVREMA